MTLQQFEYIVALDTYRHFVTAADHCFVTQPTLTLQVKKLEDEIGIQIFDRSRYPLTPTPAGEKIILKARQILREMKQMKEIISDSKDNISGEYRVGIIPTLAPYLLPLVLGEFVNKYPEISLVINELESETIIDYLKTDLLDIGILVTPLEENNIREIPLFQEPFLIYASDQNPLFKLKKVRPEDVTTEGLWLLNKGHCFRNQVLNICNKRDVPSAFRGIVYESGSIETLKNLVKSNVGYTLVPELAVTHEIENPMVKRFTDPQPAREVSIVVHNSFSKETLLVKLREEILAKIPDRFIKSKKFIKVNWK